MFFRRWLYYLSSIQTLFRGVRNWPVMLAAFLHVPLRRPFTIELRGSGTRFKVRSPMDVWIIKETCLDRDYEWGGTVLQDGWVILDVGAGLGDFAICAARCHSRSTVHAYEPFPESFVLLQENVRLNRLENVHAYPYAVSGIQPGSATLYTGASEAVQHSTIPGPGRPGPDAIEVSSMTLDRIFEDLGLESCDFLKMDCEGAEYEILFHASDSTLEKIKRICLEYHDEVTPHSHGDLIRFFSEKGFQVGLRPNRAHRHLGLIYARNLDGCD